MVVCLASMAGAGPAQPDQPRLEVPQQLRQAQLPDVRGGQLDRQRNPVQPAAHLGHHRRVRIIEPERRRRRARPVDEQLDGAELQRRLGIDGAGRECHRRELVHELAVQVQALPAGGQDADLRRREQPVGHLRRGRHKVLAVVEHDQQLPVPDRGHEPVQRTGAARRHVDLQAQRDRDRRGQQGRGAQRRQVHHADAVAEFRGHLAGRIERHRRLAHAAQADDGDQAPGSHLLDQRRARVRPPEHPLPMRAGRQLPAFGRRHRSSGSSSHQHHAFDEHRRIFASLDCDSTPLHGPVKFSKTS